MSDWQPLIIGNEIDFVSGFPFSSALFSCEEGTPLIRIRDILSQNIQTYYTGKYFDTFIVHRGDILIGMDGDFNITKWLNIDALLNQRILKLQEKSNSNINVAFLYYKLIYILLDINNKTPQTTVKHLKTRDISNCTIFAPNYKEQEEIAEILTTVDNLIEQTEAAIAKYQAIKQGMMHDLFTRGVDANGHLRPPREEAPELYKESESGWIPKEWDVVPLHKIADVNRGKFTARPRNDPLYYGGTHPFIQTGDITNNIGQIITEYSQTLSHRGTTVSKSFPANTIAVTIAANIADTCLLGIPMFFPDSIVGVEVNPPNSVRFIEIHIRRCKPLLDAKAPQSAQKNINLNDLRPLLIPLPTPEEQEAIRLIYDTLNNEIIHHEKSLGKMKSQKSGLMQDLLSGRVRVATADATATQEPRHAS